MSQNRKLVLNQFVVVKRDVNVLKSSFSYLNLYSFLPLS